MTAGSEFSRLPLAEQYRRLELLRAVVIALTAGDMAMFDRLVGDAAQTAGADVDGAELAEDVARWLEAQE